MTDWALADAKNRFSELVETSLRDGPQRVTRRGRPAVVIIAEDEFVRLREPRPSFVEHILTMPKTELDLAALIAEDEPIAGSAA